MKLLLTWTTLLLLIENAYFQKQIDVDVFYESLCPDSYRFITNQLYPSWNEIEPYVKLTFVPFGKSISLDDNVTFMCQHGIKECMGNKIQSCALSGLKNSSDQVNYVNCFMKVYTDPKNIWEYAKKCSESVGLLWNYVNECYQSNLGTSLQLKAEIDTAKYSPSFIPTIVYNKIFNQTLQDLSLKDLKGVISKLNKQ